MNVSQRLSAIQAEMHKITGLKNPSTQDDQRFDSLNLEARTLLENLARGGSVERGTPFKDDQPETRSDAHRTIDRAVRAGLPGHAAERATALLERGDMRSKNAAAQLITVAGDDAYLRAFSKLCGDPNRGHLLWTEQERASFARVEEFRAMNLSDASGGYLVPFSLDPAILLTSGGSASELRKVSRVETIVTDSWNGVTSAGVTAHWRPEAQESADDAPTLAQPVVPVHRGDAFVPFSVEVGMDSPGFAQQMAALLTDAADQLQTTAFTTGSGSGEPEGVITGAVAGGQSVINVATAGNIAIADVYNLQAALPPRFSANARFMGNVSTLNRVAGLESGNGSRQFPSVDDASTLLRKPLHELSTMDGTVETGSNYALLYGDFNNFLIVDRLGTSIELIPQVFGAAHRPTGQRGFWLLFRTGSKVLVKNAFRVLNVVAG